VFALVVEFSIRASMKLYIVTCDLLQAGDYASLYTRLASMRGFQLLKHEWAFWRMNRRLN